ncbi:pep-cterm sorting domain-containing protein [Anaeramoeba ignava]|uniref:Pep-cterm sorting domain-containing protein n=1 Tax=Anaeramoeba ignava TaxID=1746090 RepID=A0A9Q0LU12_ANAIG|nr:pep-cterm sorting domain-containing protein [Anaeramoeba ignava]
METYLNLEKLSNDLKNLFQNQNQNEKEEESYFDFEIICEQNQISFKTHKSILSSRSEYFKSLFNSKMKEYQENKLILKDVSSSILFPILNYFYSGKIEINLENAIEILIFSSKYLIDELIEIYNFEKFIKTSFFLELEENHLNSILSNDYIPINEIEIFQSLIKWGKHKSNINQKNQELEKEEKEKIKNQISNIINKIRFIDFTKKELKDTLKEDLIPNQISQKLIQFQKLQKNKEKLNQFIEKENQNSFIFKSRFHFLTESTIIEEKEHFNLIKEWINDNEFFSKMKLGFSTKKEGFDCRKWHSKCDDKGKTLIIIKTKDNYIFGGFTSIGYISDKSQWSHNYGNNGYIPDPNSFIFSLRNDKNDRKPEKFPTQPSKTNYAIYYHLPYGPNFGGVNVYKSHDICFNSTLKSGDSNFGNTYNLPNGITYQTNESKNYLAGSSIFDVDELETFFISN